MKRWLIVCLMGMGCSATGLPDAPPAANATPRTVVLYRDNLTVTMDDGSLCTGVRRGALNRWSGVLGGCPHPWQYQVVRGGVSAPRLVLIPGAPVDATLWVTFEPPGRILEYGTAP